jgi:hypothetical protein
MKKVIAVIAFLLLGFLIQAQSTLKAVSLKVGSRQTVSDSYVWDEEATPVNIPVHISEDNTITIYSKVTQKYYAIEPGEDINDHSTVWESIDIDGSRCNVYMTVIDNSLYLLIEYRTIGWYYELQEY